jgi:glutaryl-CoA dehydrogenase (non-decarboxylating)
MDEASLTQMASAQNENMLRAQRFTVESVLPLAAQIDEEQTVPVGLLTTLRKNGWLGAALPKIWGGGEMDPVSYGMVLEEFGAACSSTRTLLTVHNMAAQAIARFGNDEQRRRWLPDLCMANRIIAFALTEPQAGSDVSTLATTATECSNGYRVSGEKVWCSFGLAADLYLLFANCGGKSIALIVDRDMEGLTIDPMPNSFGTRGSMLARLRLNNVLIPVSHRIGAVGAGINFVANSALDHGRFSVAWGCVGIIRACLETCIDYAITRQQGGIAMSQHQLIRRQLTDMLLAHTSARALCVRSAQFRAGRDPRAASETALAKYHASDAAQSVANQAVALHGANGCSPEFPVSRYLRDATVANIIEGTREVHQINLASYALQKPWRHG